MSISIHFKPERLAKLKLFGLVFLVVSVCQFCIAALPYGGSLVAMAVLYVGAKKWGQRQALCGD